MPTSSSNVNLQIDVGNIKQETETGLLGFRGLVRKICVQKYLWLSASSGSLVGHNQYKIVYVGNIEQM